MPNPAILTQLRKEISINSSGLLPGISSIPILRERDYYVIDKNLDGDAPKQLIKVYEHTKGGTVRRDQLSTWTPYIAKTAEKWYPHESVLEYFINRAGQVLGLKMNEIKLYRINGQIRFLSRFFLQKSETLIHGAEICGDYLGDRAFVAEIANNKEEARELLTFEFVCDAVRSVFKSHANSILDELVRMLIFDALLGNNDRHFYNWAVIRPVRKGKNPPRLAPIYDSSRGLFWNHSRDSVVKWEKQLTDPNWKRYQKYLDGASPRFSLDKDKAVNHFQFIAHLCRIDRRFSNFAADLANPQQKLKLQKLLKNEFGEIFSPERQSLMAQNIADRFRLVNESL